MVFLAMSRQIYTHTHTHTQNFACLFVCLCVYYKINILNYKSNENKK